MYPNQFILTSDYGTLKNDSGSTTLSVTIPNGLVFNPSNSLLGSATIDVGTKNAPIRAIGTTSKIGVWTVGSFIFGSMLMQPIGQPIQDLFLLCSLYRVSPTTMRVTVSAESGTGLPNVTTRESITVTFRFTTFLSPLD